MIVRQSGSISRKRATGIQIHFAGSLPRSGGLDCRESSRRVVLLHALTNGEMDWMVWNWGDALKRYVEQITEPVDCIVLGQKLAEGFIPHWTAVAADPGNPESADGRKFTSTREVAFTRTLDESVWHNTVLAKGNLVTEINKLKQEPGQDIIAYGGAAFVSSLVKHHLIDEFHLFINPSAIGSGMAIFNHLDSKQELTLIKSRAF
jgi:dihydrofolate reductase